MQYLHEAHCPSNPTALATVLACQASSQRNLRMTYVSIDGHMVGAPVENSVSEICKQQKNAKQQSFQSLLSSSPSNLLVVYRILS